ncbi:MAG: hypothetical protein ACXADY_13315 [Candidatus Hodarchaeales archaeon]|jgi:hypothetical protein
MKGNIIGNLENLTAYYKETPLRQVVMGLLVGGLLWFCFFTLTIILDFLINDDVWWETFIKDLPWLGGIMALLVSLQIWGLLPQPSNNDNEQPSINSVKNSEDEDPTTDETTKELIETRNNGK